MTGPGHTFRYLVDRPLELDDEVELTDDETHHLTRVVRGRVGDVLELIDVSGDRWPARVDDLSGRARCRVIGPSRERAEVAPIELWIGLARWDALERITRMVTEIGVERILLLRTERIVRAPSSDKIQGHVARLDRIAHDAWRQSGSPRKPTIDGIVAFDDALGQLETRPSPGCAILDPRAARSLGEVVESAPRAILIIGPEAGFAVEELARAEARGATPAALTGFGVLRVDTAVACAAAITRSRLKPT